jgi:GrpB-like predicted nucleotidyltransferase (UPF0157 family)
VSERLDARATIERHRREILARVRDAEVIVTGSASVDSLDASDLDLIVLVRDVAKAAAALRDIYPPFYEDVWHEDWAALRDPGPPQVDVAVTRRGSRGDTYHRRAWEVLRKRPDLLTEYRRLKATKSHYVRHYEYEREKAIFFDRVVEFLREER